ncbi:MAG TPA: recombinase RecT [Ramlibacter sp.]|nr:recombinase RecT [Ramlibacter sp.]
MPDDVKSQQIEKRIDREVAGGLSIVSGAGTMTIAPRNMGELMEFAKLMAVAGDCIRPAFRGNAGACLSLCLQAFRWGADPFAVANKAYITTGKAGTQIAYEAQLINAIVHNSPMLARRLRSRYEGAGQQRKCIVTGWVRGEDEPFEYESPTIAQIAVKNSPLWQGDPDQQLAYYSTRAWARRYLPEVLLGIYSPDEVQGEVIDITPAQGTIQEAARADLTQPIPWEVFDAAGEVYEFEMSDKAVEACRKILIASAADPAMLATAWENNAAFIVSLGQDGLEDDARAIERLYAELAPKQEVGHPGQTPDGMAAASVKGGEEATPGTPPPAEATTDSPPVQQTQEDANGIDGPVPAGDAASRSEPPADLLGNPRPENLTVPLPRKPDLDHVARQLLAMIAEAPGDALRRNRIKMANESALLVLKAGAVERYDEVQAALHRGA